VVNASFNAVVAKKKQIRFIDRVRVRFVRVRVKNIN